MRPPKQLKIDSEIFKESIDYLTKNPQELLHIPEFIRKIAQRRVDSVAEEDFQALDGENLQAHALSHNLSQLKKMEAWHRPIRLLRPLVSVDWIFNNLRNLKVLSIGPRNEVELFHIISYGFAPENVFAVDILSYSDLIQLGDAHELPFEDDSFDVIIMGWVFAYSNNNQLMADEAIRVAKPGAHLAIGCRSEPLGGAENRAWASKFVGGAPIEVRREDGSVTLNSRFASTDQILRLFNGHLDAVIFNHNPHPEYVDGYSDCITVIRLK